MSAITVRCKTCQHGMKFSAEKAGKRAKCPKCDTLILIQAEEETPQVKAAAEEAVAAGAAPVVAAAPPSEEDDAAGSYGVSFDHELEEIKKKRDAEERAKARAKKDRKALPKVARKKKAIPDAAAWDRVRFGLLFTFIGVCIWIFTHFLQGAYVVIGKADFPEYAQLIAWNLERRGGEEDFPPPGKFWDVDELDIYLGMISGREFLGFARTCLVIASLFYFVQALCWGISYVICWPVPRRYGTFGQLIVSMVLGFFNFLFMFFFKLLPVLGIIGWVMIPLLVPEIAMTEYNMERWIPINILWAGSPHVAFWENVLTLIVKLSLYLQPTFGCIFLWSIGSALKDERIEQTAKGLAQLSLGTFFTLFAFHMLSLCGATPVLVWLLRVLYTVWFVFLIMFMFSYAKLILQCRGVLWERIHPANELEE